jgi:predicted component of type VI protein secretion system
MRMARVNITVPDELVDRARAADLNISRLATAAVADELDRLTKIYELDRYLADLEAVLGPIPDAEHRAAEERYRRMRNTAPVGYEQPVGRPA